MTTLSEAPRSLPTPRAEAPREVEAQVFVAPQWKLVWWKFRKHKMAMLSGIILTLIYLVALFADFLAPFDPSLTNSNYLYVPPQGMHFEFGEGKPGAYVYGVTSTVDPVALRREFKIDPSQVIPMRFWVRSWPYKLLGIFKTNIHLFGPVDPAQ